MKIFCKISLPRILSVLLIPFLASCATAPKIHLKTGDMAMEVGKKVPFLTSNIAYSPDGKTVLSGNWDGTVRLWDITSARLIKEFKGHKGHIVTVVFSPDGKTIATGGNDGIMKLWDAATGKEIRQFTGYYGSRFLTLPIANMSFSPDGRYIMVPYGSFLTDGVNGARLYEVQTSKVIKEFEGVFQDFSPDGKYVLFYQGQRKIDGSFGGRLVPVLYLVDVKTGKEIWRNEFFKGAVFSQDNRYILAPRILDIDSLGVSYTFSLVLLDASTGRKLKEFGRIEAQQSNGLNISLSPDSSRYALTGENIAGFTSVKSIYKLWDIGQDTVKEILDSSSSLCAHEFSTIPTFSRDGMSAAINDCSSMRLYNIPSGEEIANFIGFEDGEWLVTTSNGYYNSSEKGAQYLRVKAGETSYSVDSFYDVFYRPDIVAAKLRGEDIKDLITITMKDAIKTPPPSVEFTSKISDTAQPKVKVCYQAKSAGGGIGEVRLFHNGKLIQSDGYYREAAKSSVEKTQLTALNSKAIYENMRSVTIKGHAETGAIVGKSKGEVFEDCQEIETIPGENEVSVTAFNSNNTVQSYMKTARFNSKLQPEEPHLYILSIGIDQYKDNSVNLKYAVKDSKDMQEKLIKQSATLYKPQNIHYELLVDKDAGKANIISQVNELTQKIKPTDSFILFVAGHGVLLQNQYYMLTHDFDGVVSENSMINSNEIVEMSKKIKSLSQLFIFDTCHAGGVDYIVSGLYDARMSVLAKKMGLHIYASASSIQEAKDGYEGNGLFTYTLLEGLNNNKDADKNKDNKVSLTELGEYSKQTTTDISKQIGHPQTPIIINFGKDSAVYGLR